jgi:cytochrome c oxidase assembly protein subunit 15
MDMAGGRTAEPERAGTRSRDDRAVGIWLLVCCAMVFAMVVLGGATRLTESGLSMVNWHPITGVLPPMGDAEWAEAFRQYRQSPEFHRFNFWMTVEDFKPIFWLEYLHRLWGRLIGIVFIVPFLWFWLRGRVRRGHLGRLALVFVIGGAQGLLGWYMVKSGLVDRPEVSQYRLAAHLALAFAIYGYMLWLALGLLLPRAPGTPDAGPAPPRRLARFVFGWSALTVVAGAFVAGLDAGLAFNTFPLMGETFVPDGLFLQAPWPVNFFENTATVQLTHRLLAETLLCLVLWLWVAGLRAGCQGRARRALHALAAMAVVQVGLGIATLLSAVQIGLAVLHQAGALTLFSLALWTVYELGTRESAATGTLRANSAAPSR